MFLLNLPILKKIHFISLGKLTRQLIWTIRLERSINPSIPRAYSQDTNRVSALLLSQADSKKDAAPMDDSDLEKKRRETDALLQSMGITSADVPVGKKPCTSRFLTDLCTFAVYKEVYCASSVDHLTLDMCFSKPRFM